MDVRGGSIQRVRGLNIATQGTIQLGVTTTSGITSGRQHFHESAAKAWGSFTASGGSPVWTLDASFNVNSLDETFGVDGLVTITFVNPMKDTNYFVHASLDGQSTNDGATILGTGIKTTGFQLVLIEFGDVPTNVDGSFIVYGQLA